MTRRSAPRTCSRRPSRSPVELGGVRFITLAPVTERAGLHRTGVRRYYASKEELLLELAERGWQQWRDKVTAAVGDRAGLGPREVAAALSETLARCRSSATC